MDPPALSPRPEILERSEAGGVAPASSVLAAACARLMHRPPSSRLGEALFPFRAKLSAVVRLLLMLLVVRLLVAGRLFHRTWSSDRELDGYDVRTNGGGEAGLDVAQH